MAFEVARARALSDARNSDAGIAANIASYVVEKPRSRAQFRQSFTFAPFRAVIARIARRGFARRRDFARHRDVASRTNPVAALGFDVTASLRDQCDALSCDDLTSSPANADESALVAALDGLKSAASKIERLEASSLKPSDARADGSPRPRVAASSPFA